ncbi:hypothetical protein ACTPEF_24460, partial [Clostridioides difficile]
NIGAYASGTNKKIDEAIYYHEHIINFLKQGINEKSSFNETIRFVDIKEKYINCGMRCMNYISLKNLLEFVNLEFSGDAHDPLND